MRSLKYVAMPAGNTNVKRGIKPRKHRRPFCCFLPRVMRPQVVVTWR